MLNSFTQRRSARLFELQSRIGTLQFACKAVVPGGTVLQRMINLTKGVPAVFTTLDVIGSSLKIWRSGKTFLADWTGRSFFLNTTVIPSPQMELYTDALGTIGYGGYFNWELIQGQWLPHMQLNNITGTNIEWQDLFPIVVACAICYGTPIFPGNVFNFGAITSPWSL